MLMCQKKRLESDKGEVAEWFEFADQIAEEARDEILTELEAACLKHPSFCLDNLLMGLAVTMEELGETAEAMLDGNIDHAIHEMAQVGACVHRFIDEAKRMKAEDKIFDANDPTWKSLAEGVATVGRWAKVRLDRVIKEAQKQ